MLVGTGTGMLMAPARLSVLGKMLTPRRYRDPVYAQASAPELHGGRIRRPPDEVRRVARCYRTTQPFGGNRRFVLFTNGHAAAQVTPHGHPKTPRRTNKDSTVHPDACLRGTETDQGTCGPTRRAGTTSTAAPSTPRRPSSAARACPP